MRLNNQQIAASYLTTPEGVEYGTAHMPYTSFPPSCRSPSRGLLVDYPEPGGFSECENSRATMRNDTGQSATETLPA